MIVGSVPGLKCKISPNDKIPLMELLNHGTGETECMMKK